MYHFRNKASFTARSCQHHFQPLKLEDHSLSAVLDCLFDIFAATLHIGGRSFIRNLRTRHAVKSRLYLRDLLLAQLWTVNPVSGTLYLMSTKITIPIPLVQRVCSVCAVVMCE